MGMSVKFARKYTCIIRCLILFTGLVFVFNVLIQMTLITLHKNDQSDQWSNQRMQEVEFIAKLSGPLLADDPELVNILRRSFLHPPSEEPSSLMIDRKDPMAVVYNQYRTGFPSFMRINKLLQRAFNDTSSGFFVEAGALDGEFVSNTLFLEKSFNWTGLLIEVDLKTFQNLLLKKRKSWSSNSCISLYDYAKKETFIGYKGPSNNILDDLLSRSTGNLEGISPPAYGMMGETELPIKVQCFPLHTYLLALNKTFVDYISLDVEGAEADILIHFPWTKIQVPLWSIEHRIIGSSNKFRDFLQEKPLPTKKDVGERSQRFVKNKIPESKSNKRTNLNIQSDLKSPVGAHQPATRRVQITKIVYTNRRDPSKGIDKFFVQFMGHHGYHLLDYWDGDYTFVNKSTSLYTKLVNKF